LRRALRSRRRPMHRPGHFDNYTPRSPRGPLLLVTAIRKCQDRWGRMLRSAGGLRE
jgi:hypothetical protein